jgi:hypothetical protein
VLVGAGGLLLTVVVDTDDDVLCWAVRDGCGLIRIWVEEILTLHNLAFRRIAGYERLAKVADTRC